MHYKQIRNVECLPITEASFFLTLLPSVKFPFQLMFSVLIRGGPRFFPSVASPLSLLSPPVGHRAQAGGRGRACVDLWEVFYHSLRKGTWSTFLPTFSLLEISPTATVPSGVRQAGPVPRKKRKWVIDNPPQTETWGSLMLVESW